MLLAAYADAAYFLASRSELPQHIGYRVLRSVDPVLGILLERARRQPLDESVSLFRGGDDLAALPIQGDGLCALCAAVDA